VKGRGLPDCTYGVRVRSVDGIGAMKFINGPFTRSNVALAEILALIMMEASLRTRARERPFLYTTMTHTIDLPQNYTFEDPDADIFLGSSHPDSSTLALLRVHSTILSLASPVWQQTVAAAPVSNLHKKRLAVPEPYEVLEPILLSIYPNSIPPVLPLDTLIPVLDACVKYQLAASLQKFRGMLVLPKSLEEPFRVFATACRLRFVEEAKQASTHCIRSDILDQHTHRDEEMKEVSAKVYFQLITVRKETLAKALAKAEALGNSCANCSSDNKREFLKLKEVIKSSLQRDPLSVEFLQLETVLPHIQPFAPICGNCFRHVSSCLPSLKAYIQNLSHTLDMTDTTDTLRGYSHSSYEVRHPNSVSSASPSSLNFTFGSLPYDIVLRSEHAGTGSNIKAHKLVLSAFSSVFRDMFSLPQETSAGTEIPEIIMQESRDTMAILLGFIYPNEQFGVATDLDPMQGFLALSAAEKYDMPCIVGKLKNFLASHAEKDPLLIFSLACSFRSQEIAEVAAKFSLRVHIYDAPLPQELQDITAFAYDCLLHLHRTRGREAASLLEKMPVPSRCSSCGTLPKWLSVFRNKAIQEVKKRPNSDIIFGMDFLAGVVDDSHCSSCGASVLKSREMLDNLRGKIDALPTALVDVIY
jgi:hypothetical protein